MIGLCQNELPFLDGSNNISDFYGLQQNCPWPLTLFIPQFMSKFYGPKLHCEKYFLKIKLLCENYCKVSLLYMNKHQRNFKLLP